MSYIGIIFFYSFIRFMAKELISVIAFSKYQKNIEIS